MVTITVSALLIDHGMVRRGGSDRIVGGDVHVDVIGRGSGVCGCVVSHDIVWRE